MTPRTLNPLCARIGKDKVAHVVHDFYSKLLADPQLAIYFKHIQDLPAHEAHITEYWWTAMGGRPDAHRPFDMVGRHKNMQLDPALFARWLDLFDAAMVAHLEPELASQWSQMTHAIGGNLQRILGVAEQPPEAR